MDDNQPRFEYQADEVAMTDDDRQVLAALPTLMTQKVWPATIAICERVDAAHPDVVRSCLARLQARYLVEKGGETFARTPRGTFALELGVDRPNDSTRFGPSDKAGQPCMGQCGRLAPRPGPGPGEAFDQGWRYNQGEDRFAWAFLCPDCRQKPDLAARADACRFPQDEGWRADPI